MQEQTEVAHGVGASFLLNKKQNVENNSTWNLVYFTVYFPSSYLEKKKDPV